MHTVTEHVKENGYIGQCMQKGSRRKEKMEDSPATRVSAYWLHQAVNMCICTSTRILKHKYSGIHT